MRRYEAQGLREALQQVKAELGPQAVILSTREIRKRTGAFGLFARPLVEVTAAPPEDFERANEKAEPPGRALRASLASLKEDLTSLREEVKGLPIGGDGTSLRRELEELRNLILALGDPFPEPKRKFPPALEVLRRQMLFRGLSPGVALKLLDRARAELPASKLESTFYVKIYCARLLMGEVKVTGPLKGKAMRAAFIGPTGVGKTTTIAKLAARLTFREGKRVALVTVDTFRIAALEQLRIYAQLMKLPVEVVFSPEELGAALRRHQEADAVLIDTAGRSQRDEAQMGELKEFFGKGEIDCHLVLSAATSQEDLSQVLERFGQIPLKSLLFTKLDEANRFGVILNQSLSSGIPLSYFTTGQRVPEDIEVATPERVADLVLPLPPAEEESRA
ncbi:MAG: flagellar biosynthesis protein FlhF [Nitrospinota bacterium]